ncbi:unnamed protein product, partial [Allacma fusca]
MVCSFSFQSSPSIHSTSSRRASFLRLEIAMDFPIEDRSAQNPVKLDEKVVKRPTDSAPLPPFEGEGVSKNFEDDLMMEFNQKHSSLSTFLDDRVSDLTSAASAQSDQQVVPGSKNPFGQELHDLQQQEYGYEFVQGQDAGKNFGGDNGIGAREKAIGESLFKFDTANEIANKTEPGAGDHGKFLDEHEQLMGQFERVSPNMINYGYEETMATRSSSHFPDSLTTSQEVPFSTGHQTFSAPSFGQQQQRTNEMDDDEDDFEQDSISRQSQSQALSNKLSDSLEALKDIPKEKEMPPPVQDHFAAPGTQRRGLDEEEDDFEKDSISSHPLSQKLSDSLEVLKDSPQKDLKFDESLMDLDELPSSKNSIKSISPNEVPNIADDFADVSTASTLQLQGQKSTTDSFGGGLEDSSSSLGSLPATTDIKALAVDNFSSDTNNFSVPTNFPPPENLLSDNNASSNAANVNSDSSPLVDFASLLTQEPNLPEVAQAASFGLPDISNSSTLSQLPEVTATAGITSNLLLSDALPEVTDITSHGNLPDVTSSAQDSSNVYVEEEEDLPPPIPPHQNLPISPPDVSARRQVDGDRPEFFTNGGGQQEIQQILNPFDNSTAKVVDYVNKYGIDDPVLETFEEPEELPPPVPQRDVESKDQHSVTEELEEILPPEKEPAFEYVPPPSFLESQTMQQDFYSEPSDVTADEDLRQKQRDAELLVNEVLEIALPKQKEEPKFESIITPADEVSIEPEFENFTEPEPYVEPVVEIKQETRPEPTVEIKEEPKVPVEVPKLEPKEEPTVIPKPDKAEVAAKVEKPKKQTEFEEAVELSEDVQQILNTFNP